MTTSSVGAFVGRQREMEELKAALEGTLSGQGQLVMLAGEPGIGKTCTAHQLASIARQRGSRVLTGRCHETQGAPPYWVWLQIVRRYVAECDAEQLRYQMGAGVVDLAEVVPELKEYWPDLRPPPALEPQQARFRLFDSITTFLKRASGVQRLMLFLDNLHWADQPSLLLLEFLVQEISDSNLLVVGTYRDTELTQRHPLHQTLGELAGQPSFHHVTLRGLAEEEVAQFLKVTSGFRPPLGLVRTVHTQTEGNPLFMTQVVQLMAQEGNLKSEAAEGHQWNIRIPAGVYDAIGRRIDKLSDGCNRILMVASVIGREFELWLLERVESNSSTSSQQNLAGEELLEAVEEGLTTRLIEELPQSVGCYQFSHVLIQNTLSQRLSTVRRARLHQWIAEALEEHYGSDVDSHAPELAYHFAEAKMVSGIEKLVKYSLLAGEQALVAYAHEEAIVQFERGLAAKGVLLTGRMPAREAEEAALLSGLGRAQLAVLDPHEYQKALANLIRAFDYYAKTGDIGRAVAIAQCPIQTSPLIGRHTGVIDLIIRALALVSPGSLEAGYLLCQYGNTLYYETSNYNGAMEALVQALAIAQSEDDEVLKMRALVAAGHAEAAYLHFQESLGYDLAAIELAGSVDEPFEETHAHQEVAAVLHRTGDLEGARRHASTALEVAERLRHRTRLWQTLQANTVVSVLRGDWETARSLSNRALVVSPRNANLLGYRALIECLVGGFDHSGAYLERLLEAMRQATPGPTFEYAYPAIMVPLIVHLTSIDYPLEEARAAAHYVLSSPWVSPVFASLAWAGVALLSVKDGDVEAAEEQYKALQPRGGAMVGGLHDSIISADRLLGLLAYIVGRPEEATVHFQTAMAFCREAGYRPELAWTCYDYAKALLQRGLTDSTRPVFDDRDKVILLLEEALAIATELGMRPLLERVQSLQEKVALRPGSAPVYPDGLSQREVEVLCLIAAGKNNREIADELGISVGTVANHVTSILNKTGLNNRTEAATYAIRHGLA
jgi:DNA-binding CsgD family transcriptional regulator